MIPMLLVFPNWSELLKAYIHGHYRLNRRTGKRVWIESHQDKRPERGRTTFTNWAARRAHFEHHLAHGKQRLALHAFHDLNHADSHTLATELGLAQPGETHADKGALMEALHGALSSRAKVLGEAVAAQVRADWTQRKASGKVGKTEKARRAKAEREAKRQSDRLTENLAKGDRIKAYLESGGTVRLVNPRKILVLNKPEYIKNGKDGVYVFEGGKRWAFLFSHQVDELDAQVPDEFKVGAAKVAKPAAVPAADPAPQASDTKAPAADGPQDGDTKTENGITYTLRGGRWHRDTPDDQPSNEATTDEQGPLDDGLGLEPDRAQAGATPASRPANTAEQPYQEDGIKLSRGDITQHATTNQLPSDLAGSLRPHAQDAVNLALEKFDEGYKSFLIADGTGAGKTRESLAIAESLRRKEPGKPILIVTQNTRVISDAFVRDAETMGVAIKPVETLAEVQGGGLYVTAYSRVSKGDFAGGQFGTVIFDEAHNLKNYTSKKTKGGTDLVKAADRSLLLTATPGDKAEHVGYLATAFGFNFIKAMHALGYERGDYGFERRRDVSLDESLQRLGGLFDDLTRRGLMVKREVSMDNIDVHQNPVRLSEADQRTMDRAWDAMESEAADAPPMRRGLVKMLGLAKLRTALEPMKLDATMAAVQADLKAGKKVVVFANRINNADLPEWWPDKEGMAEDSVGTLDALAARLEAAGIRTGRLYGKHLSKAKGTLAGFQDGDTQVVIATPQAGGTGINLDDTAGDKPRSMVVMTAPFSALEAVQQIGRINRLTTKSRADVRFLISDTAVDDWNFGIILTKLARLGASVEGDIGKLDLTRVATLADADLAAMGLQDVPVRDGREISTAALGLKDPAQTRAEAAEAAKAKVKTYLRVPYDDKDFAKSHGAKWDPERRQWYVFGDVPQPLNKYLSGPAAAPTEATAAPAAQAAPEKTYLRVPYDEKDHAKRFGAKWDGARKQWYVLGEVHPNLHKYLVAPPRRPMTLDQIEATRAALERVQDNCDGARDLDGMGFNKMDTGRAHVLLSLSDWTPEEAERARAMAYKYKRQFGQDLAERMGRPEAAEMEKAFPSRLLFCFGAVRSVAP